MTCPTCGGHEMPGHPCGWLAIDHLTSCPLYEADDATRAADSFALRSRRSFTRPATNTERTLLAGRGLTLPEALDTHVRGSSAVPARTWPALTNDERRAGSGFPLSPRRPSQRRSAGLAATVASRGEASTPQATERSTRGVTPSAPKGSTVGEGRLTRGGFKHSGRSPA